MTRNDGFETINRVETEYFYDEIGRVENCYIWIVTDAGTFSVLAYPGLNEEQTADYYRKLGHTDNECIFVHHDEAAERAAR